MDFIKVGISEQPDRIPYLLQEVKDTYIKCEAKTPSVSNLMLIVATQETFKLNGQIKKLRDNHIRDTNTKLKEMSECFERLYSEAKRCYTSGLYMSINIRSIREFDYMVDISDEEKIEIWKNHNPELMYVIDFVVNDLVSKGFKPELKASFAPTFYNGVTKPCIDFGCNLSSNMSSSNMLR